MNTITKNSPVMYWLLALALSVGIMHAASGGVSPLGRADLVKVETILSKALKGKPTVLSGTKQQMEGGWKVICVANVGRGGAYELVVVTEPTFTLGYIESQKPKAEAGTAGKRRGSRG